MKIAVASGKGGVGKSMLASALAMLFVKNKKVVAVDCDVDAPNLHLWLGQKENWDSIERISTNEKPVIDPAKCNLCGKCVDICAFNALTIKQFSNLPRRQAGLTINPFFCEGCGACEVICPQKAIKMEPVENAEIRIKTINLVCFDDMFHRSEVKIPLVSAQLYPGETGSGKIVDETKSQAEKFDYEVMILDSPAGTGCPVIAALKDADFSVLVTEPTPSGLSDLKRVLTVVNHFQIPFGVVINKWDINPSLTLRINKEFKEKMLGKISYDKRIFQAIAALTPIVMTNLPANKEIGKIYAKLMNRLWSKR